MEINELVDVCQVYGAVNILIKLISENEEKKQVNCLQLYRRKQMNCWIFQT